MSSEASAHHSPQGAHERTPGASRNEASEPVYWQLRTAIHARTFSADHLFLETGIAGSFAVSRATARVALLRLESDGLLTRASRGYRLRQLSPTDIIELYNARILLEGEAAALAATARTEYDLTRLSLLADQLGSSLDAPAQARSANRQWHQSLRQAAHNGVLLELLDRVGVIASLYSPQALDAREVLSESHRAHRAVTNAIADRDAERARSALVDHIRRARDLRVQALAAEGVEQPGATAP